jgi:hypothetical protein
MLITLRNPMIAVHVILNNEEVKFQSGLLVISVAEDIRRRYGIIYGWMECDGSVILSDESTLGENRKYSFRSGCFSLVKSKKILEMN